jgi:hypothetical protein
MRKLTRKSQFKFGKYSDCIVQNILDLDPEYVSWVYFNQSNINFFDDILTELGILENLTIDKPGKDNDKWFEYKKQCYNFLYDTKEKKGMRKKQKYWKGNDENRNKLFRSIERNGKRDRFVHSINTNK